MKTLAEVLISLAVVFAALLVFTLLIYLTNGLIIAVAILGCAFYGGVVVVRAWLFNKL